MGTALFDMGVGQPAQYQTNPGHNIPNTTEISLYKQALAGPTECTDTISPWDSVVTEIQTTSLHSQTHPPWPNPACDLTIVPQTKSRFDWKCLRSVGANLYMGGINV